MEKRKGENEESTRITRMRWRKKGRIGGKDNDKKYEMNKRKEEYEERTRIKE